MKRKPQRWQATALAAATALLLGVSSFDAQALALGRLTVQSALGEPLRAEIDIPDINADEAASLKAGVASPEAFKAAGLDYNLTVANMQIALMRRPDGRMFLRLSSDRAVNDPFLDLILEANWSSGRIVRDYTLLFDPPALRQGNTVIAPTAPQISPPRTAPGTTPPPVFSPPAAAAPAAPSARAPAAPRTPATRPAAPAAREPSGDGKQVTVQSGDTAGKIAAANKPASVSLDQMLVALLRANPDAFIAGNINRVKAGAVLDLPSAEQASSVPSGEASQMLVAQSKDFNDFRRKLAEGAPTTQLAAADRTAGGKVQARVEDKKPSAATPDKLTLSKGAVKANEDKIAKNLQNQNASTRVAELSKNISELNRLGAASGAPGSTPAAGASAAKGVSVPVGALGVASAPRPAVSAPASALPPAVAALAKPASAPAPVPAAVAAPAPAPVVAPAPAPVASAPAVVALPATVASAPAVPASAPAMMAAASAAAAPASSAATATTAPDATASAAAAPKPPVKAPVAAPPPPPEPSLIDQLMENPLIPGAVILLLALLGGFGFYRIRQRRRSTQVDSSFLESRLQPDSFFGASGGQRIDTNEGGATGSSMVYSPSQLDAAGDVDPVAEADVYLAYGRDLQAEEILKEAMRTNPARVAIHGKLLEIYAKRRDGKAFEVVATEAFGLTHGEGPEWEHICELGRELDSSNPMYQPGGAPAQRPQLSANAPMGTGFATSTIPQAIQPELEESPDSVDLDLDLDFSLGDDPAPAPAPARAPVASEQTIAMKPVPAAPSLDMDFGAATVSMQSAPPPSAPSVTDTVKLSVPDLALSSSSLSFSPEPAPAPAPKAAPPAPAVMDAGMIEFDLGALSLDLGPTTEAPSVSASSGNDPLETKLALAEEFRGIGDTDGARALVQEVVAEASGSLKAKAERFLAELT